MNKTKGGQRPRVSKLRLKSVNDASDWLVDAQRATRTFDPFGSGELEFQKRTANQEHNKCNGRPQDHGNPEKQDAPATF
jgi:hypothetical protein